MRALRLSTALALVLVVGCDDTRTTDAGVRTDAGSPSTDGGGAEDAGSVDAGPGPDVAHLLITEVGLQPEGNELVEIMNPTANAVDLSDYYLADNSAYHEVTGDSWAPSGTPQTDWLVRFPDGATLAPGAVAVVALSAAFESVHARCPDYIVDLAEADLSCGGGSVPAMDNPLINSVGNMVGSLLSNGGEMIVLFHWDGSGSRVTDVDYVTFDPDSDPATHVDKTAVAGYQPDTAEASQRPAPLPAASQTIERCDDTEPGETLFGGNGVGGHDETSEDLASSFAATDTPSPGTVNSCL